MFLEDAGFDWKILGPDVRDLDYVAWQCDQDAYACSGQKCSAQSLLMAHTNYMQAGGPALGMLRSLGHTQPRLAQPLACSRAPAVHPVTCAAPATAVAVHASAAWSR